MTNYAVIDFNSAKLSTEFGEKIARKWFGDKIVDEMPRFVKGPRKGALKGVVTWKKVVRGGWVRGGDYESGYVENRVGHIFDRELRHLPAWGHNEGALVVNIDDRNTAIDGYIRRIASLGEDLAVAKAAVKKIVKTLREVETSPSIPEANRPAIIEIIKDDIARKMNIVDNIQAEITRYENEIEKIAA